MGGVSYGLFRVFYFIRLPFCLILALLASFGLLFISSTSVESKMCILLICICVLCESILYFFLFYYFEQRIDYRLMCRHFLAFPFSSVYLICYEIFASL